LGSLLSRTVSTAEEPRRAITVRGVLELAVVVVFALLIWNNYSLRRQQARSAAAVKSARAFAVHDSIDSLPVVEWNGSQRRLQLDRRTIVAIVDPGCDSCRHLLAELRPESGAQVFSVASLAATRAMAEARGITAVTHVLGDSGVGPLDPRLHIYPQLFVVDRGKVVRTCASIDECATTTTVVGASPVPGQ
jgi:hypothetical protein